MKEQRVRSVRVLGLGVFCASVSSAALRGFRGLATPRPGHSFRFPERLAFVVMCWRFHDLRSLTCLLFRGIL